ncbi:MAG: hypothetical protein ACREOG_03830, partial [Gemmatimonadaceae bacterium]
MIRTSSRAIHVAAVLVTLGVGSAPLSVVQAQNLPAAKDLIAKYVAAVGGVDAFKKYKSVRVKAAFDVPAQGMSGTL